MRNAILLVLALALGSCAGSSDPAELVKAGLLELNSGRYDAAVDKLDRALKAMTPEDPQFIRASAARCQARAHQDPAGAVKDFLSLSQAHADKVAERDFELVADALRSQGAYREAGEVLKAGMQRFPESPKLAALRDQIGRDAEQSSDAALVQDMRGLGYIGDK